MIQLPGNKTVAQNLELKYFSKLCKDSAFNEFSSVTSL